jgi:hypothetical protein
VSEIEALALASTIPLFGLECPKKICFVVDHLGITNSENVKAL